ncbi:MAG: hypothetical protein HOP18_19385 [Deltaproteobacteria bacterium]|nr:hypothetical protein [Deltaproteobacteria bacterium]
MARLLLIVLLLVCGCSRGTRPVLLPAAAFHPPSWQARSLAVRQTWETLVAERTAREQRATADHATEAYTDALRQLPVVSLTTGGQTTLAEALTLLLADLPYTVVYGPYVEPTISLATYISHQRLDRAVATLVHPLGYAVTVEPTAREIHIDALVTRHWTLSPRPVTDAQFWTRLHDTLQVLVHGASDTRRDPGMIVANPEAGEVTVSARVPRMALIEAHMRPLAVATTPAEAPVW